MWVIFFSMNSESYAAVEVRLMNGKTPHDGRVEVRKDNRNWSTICNLNWGLREAYVVCRMLNYTRAVSFGTAKVKGTGGSLAILGLICLFIGIVFWPLLFAAALFFIISIVIPAKQIQVK